MFHLKETALRDKFENFRQNLDSNYNSSHSKLSDKLNELSREVNSLKDNLSKTVRKAMEVKKNMEKIPNAQEGKKSTSKLNPEKQPDIVNNIESRVVQLNEKLSDLKTWNISQLNQLDEQELELEDLLEKMTLEFRIFFEAQLDKSENAKLKKNSEPKKSNLKHSKSQDLGSSQSLSDTDTKSETNKSVSFDAPDGDEVSCGPPILLTSSPTTGSSCVVLASSLGDVCGPHNVAHGGWSKADDSIFIREVAHACAQWERSQQMQQTSVLLPKVKLAKNLAGVQNPGGTMTSSDKRDLSTAVIWLPKYDWYYKSDQMLDNFLQKVWAKTSGKISSTDQIKFYMDKFIEQERKREKRKREIEKWKEEKMKEGFVSKLDHMKSRLKKTSKEREKKVSESVMQTERREMIKMRQSLRNSEKLLRVISVQN